MKKLLFTGLLLTTVFMNAQQDLYWQVKKQLEINHPEISDRNRLIAINFWSTSDAESREANRSFEKAYKVYESARLKGGMYGMIAIAVNKEALSSTATITLAKDGISKLLSFKMEDLKPVVTEGLKNIVFDSDGNAVYRNLPPDKIFSSVNQLITR
jgi:hypothetical protein